ncbi:Chaperone DnaJ-domain superfamily protein [Raphanus sativus]|uniref:Chaperone protein dnaJ 11, chloroplastic n=1 Tax=Raphanus sativus TaxID=3726 RepID=A0A6J0JFM3_RAPSA|nr:chaperone protein dnaJ 11, chloroplastic [Raphanus sativus]KAJ4886497.1 Chaperone DnaJ-domain superfamily protein [Raphanus sativus]
MSGILVNFAGNPLRFSQGTSLTQPKPTRSHRGNARFPSSFKASSQTLNAEPAVTETARRRAWSSLYELLRVDETASLPEIKTAYRSLAKVYHPDAASVESADGRDFMEIHRAYATLADPTTRAIYDSTLGARRRRVHAGAMGRTGRAYATTRRWETDQCW